MKRKIIDYSIIGAVAVLFVLVALYADRRKKTLLLDRVRVTVRKADVSSFVEEAEIRETVEKAGVKPGEILCRDIDVRALQRELLKNPYIRRANCYVGYFSGGLFVDVQQFEPVLRVIDRDGKSYFLDAEGRCVAKNNRNGYDVPVLTNHRPGLLLKKSGEKNDDIEKIVTFVKYAEEDDFLNSLITQINITEGGIVELIPRVGRQVVVLGRLEELGLVPGRLEKLRIFLKEGKEAGAFDRYSRIDVSHGNQIVGTPRR